ncbi:MAG: class I SAM-dependent methyltransferase [Nitrospirota bacterium]
MDRSLRKGERNYYLSRGHALDFDRRSASPRSLGRHRAVARKLAEFISGGDLLDIGCGSARMLVVIAGELPAVRITGMDVSGEMLSLAGENVREAGLEDRITLKEMSAEELRDFPADCFRAVQSHGAFSGWLEPEGSLREIRRILRPGGILYLRDWNRSAPEEALGPYLESASPEQARRVRMAYESSYTFVEFGALLRDSPLALVELGAEGLWMEAVLRAEK